MRKRLRRCPQPGSQAVNYLADGEEQGNEVEKGQAAPATLGSAPLNHGPTRPTHTRTGASQESTD